METRVQRWGNSLAVRIPKAFAEEIHLAENAAVYLTLEEGRVVLTPAAAEVTLSELLEQVTPENIHSEWETGPRRGAEAW
jgi:antitoxin MazE